MNIKDPKKAIEALEKQRELLERPHTAWNREMFDRWKAQTRKILAEHGFPESIQQGFAKQVEEEANNEGSSNTATIPIVIVRGAGFGGKATAIDGKDELSPKQMIDKIEEYKRLLDKLIDKLEKQSQKPLPNKRATNNVFQTDFSINQ